LRSSLLFLIGIGCRFGKAITEIKKKKKKSDVIILILTNPFFAIRNPLTYHTEL
jgi:hypothetical protein